MIVKLVFAALFATAASQITRCPPRSWMRVDGPRSRRCRTMEYPCAAGYLQWSDDECGCGCRPVVCANDTNTCADGSTVVRDPTNNCTFPVCDCPPEDWTRVDGPRSRRCRTMEYPCPEGYAQWSHDECGCGCRPDFCTRDVRKCADGSVLVRDPENNCQFPECRCPPPRWTRVSGPRSRRCRTMEYECDVDYEQWSHDECGCGCRPIACPPGNVKTCADGSTLVVRGPRCEFPECECPPRRWIRVDGPLSKRCRTMEFPCDAGYEKWSHNECGCGCRPIAM